MTKRQQIQRKPVPQATPFEVAVFACQQLNQQERITLIKWLGLEIGVPLYTQEDMNKRLNEAKQKRSPILSLKDV